MSGDGSIPTTQTRDAEEASVDSNRMPRDEALRLAIDAIKNDSRREPYGHHQWGRDLACATLRDLLEGGDGDA